MEDINIQLPAQVGLILDTLKYAGFEGYAVGGCVRDILLGKQPKDWDICTDALPEQTIAIFSGLCSVIPTGLKHGTVTIVMDSQHFEVTTYRIDGDYSDSRWPDNVYFTKSITKDLARRDFTINAIAYNPVKGLVDPFNGKKDIENQLIICVGNADARIKEDYLRALRAVRFACSLSFKIEQNTIESIIHNKELIKYISRERIRDELIKILVSNKAGYGISLLKAFRLLEYIIPGLYSGTESLNNNEFNKTDVFDYICSALDNAPKSLVVRLSILVNYMSAQPNDINTLKGQLKYLKFDNATVNKVTTFIYEQKNLSNLSDKELKKMIVRIGIENIDDYFDFMNAVCIHGGGSYFEAHILASLKERCDKIISEKQPLSTKDLNISGNELIELGFHPGKDIGFMLKKLMDLVSEKPEINQTHTLIEIVKQELNIRGKQHEKQAYQGRHCKNDNRER